MKHKIVSVKKQVETTPEVRQFLSKIGRIGGLKGGPAAGKRTADLMTPEQRIARAKKAAAASVKARRKRARMAQQTA